MQFWSEECKSYNYELVYNKNTEDVNYNRDYSSENQTSSIACSCLEVLLLSVWELEDSAFILLLLLSAEGITIEIKHEQSTINSSEEWVDINNDIEQKYRKNNTLLLEYKTLNKFQWISQDQTEGHCAQLEIASRALLWALEHISSEHFLENNFCRVYAQEKVRLTKTLCTTENWVPSGFESFQKEVGPEVKV